MAELTRRPRLLFLCQTLPFPPDGGVWIRTYHVLRLLAQTFDITALCFERAATAGPAAGGPLAWRFGLGRFAETEVFAIPQRHSRLRFLWDHLRSVAIGKVYTTYLYDSRAFRRAVETALAVSPPDVVHVDSLDLARYLPLCEHLPIVGVHHDVESALLARRAAIEPSLWRRLYLRHQSNLMAIVERRWCPRLALNVAVSDADRARLEAMYPDVRVTVIPNGVDIHEFHPDVDVPAGEPAASGVAYVGGTSTGPNRDALVHFSHDILPHLTRIAGRVPIRWIGRATAEEQRQYQDQHGIELTGYVDDVRPHMRDAACHIVPLRAGGGTRIKILNAWAMGKAVVSTSVGCEGLDAVDHDNLLIRDEPAAFAEAVARVLSDAELRRRLGTRGRETVERRYSWDVMGRAMTSVYLEAARAWHASRARLESAEHHAHHLSHTERHTLA